MIYKEFGENNPDTMIFLHGGVVKELKGLYHGDISINHADEYVKLLRTWME